MIAFLINALKIIFLLGFLVLIHEGGHFVVAKLCKVKVNEFAIGFGPTLISKQTKETKYALHLIPLGGFVSLEGEEEHSNVEGSFSNTSIPKKIAIIVAGGAVNIIFGLLVYFILISSSGNFSNNVVDYTLDNYSAKEAGIVQKDQIISINDKKVKTSKDINKYLLSLKNEEKINLKVKRENEIINVELQPTNVQSKDLGIYFSSKENATNQVKIIALDKDAPAQKAGIKENDIIVEINGKEISNNYEAVELIQNSETENIKLKIKRNEKILEFDVKPNIKNNYFLGIVFEKAENTLKNKLYYGAISTNEFIVSIFDNLKEVFTGKVNVNQMVGIVGISDIVVQTSGAYEYIYMIALISLSLGLTNLLPFPPLDGGKIVIYLIEAIRKKQMNEKIEIQLQMLGFALLILLSIYITYNDILRII